MKPVMTLLGRFETVDLAELKAFGLGQFFHVLRDNDTVEGSPNLKAEKSLVGICVPPFWSGESDRLVAIANYTGGPVLLAAEWLRTHLVEAATIFESFEVAILSEPLQFDDEVGLVVEDEIDTIHKLLAFRDVFVSLGVGSASSLPEIFEESNEYPKWDYICANSLRRLALNYSIHWGGNLPVENPEWMVANLPECSRGFFVTSSDAFPAGSPNQDDFATVKPSAIPEAVRALSDVCTRFVNRTSG